MSTFTFPEAPTLNQVVMDEENNLIYEYLGTEQGWVAHSDASATPGAEPPIPTDEPLASAVAAPAITPSDTTDTPTPADPAAKASVAPQDASSSETSTTTPVESATPTAPQADASVSEEPITPTVEPALTIAQATTTEPVQAAAPTAILVNAQDPATLTAALQQPVFVKETETWALETSVVKERIENYIKQMSPGVPRTEATSAPFAAQLYQDLQTIMGIKDPTEFNRILFWLLDKIFEHRTGCFGDMYLRRGFDLMSLKGAARPTDLRAEYDALLSLLTTVGHQRDRRRALANIDLTRALKLIRDPAKQQRMSAFFATLR